MLSRPNLIALIVASASIIQQLDSTIIATSLPQMANSLHGSAVELGGAVTSYALSLAIFIPLSGWLADRIGASLVFRSAIVIFTIGSALCGLSETIPELTASRFLQGFGGALMMPIGRLLVLQASEGSQFVTAMAWLQVPAQLGPVIGLPLGGLITTYASWRWNFFINIPVGAAGIVAATIFIKNEPISARRPFDATGFVLSGLSLSLLVQGLDQIGLKDSSLTNAFLMIASSAVGMGATIWHSYRHPSPLIDLSLIKIPTFRANLFAGSFFRWGVDALPFLLPLLFQLGFGMNPLDSGLLTVASAVGSLAMRFLAKPILRRFGFRRVLLANGLISGVTIVACAAFSASTPIWIVIGLLTFGGFFRALQFVSLNTIAFADVEPKKMSSATSMATMVQQLANAISVALAVIVVHIELSIRGSTAPQALDLRLAIIAMGLIAFASIPMFYALRPEAGARFSEHKS